MHSWMHSYATGAKHLPNKDDAATYVGISRIPGKSHLKLHVGLHICLADATRIKSDIELPLPSLQDKPFLRSHEVKMMIKLPG